jgi:hypothetical protein
MLAPDVGLLWLLLLLGPLLFFQRRLHREAQIILFLLTRRRDLTLIFFSLVFLPGVLLHESSHFLMARLLGVGTGKFSLMPRPLEGGKLQLGFVETDRADWVREALIGLAPLLSGGLFVAYAGLRRLQLLAFWAEISSSGYRFIGSDLQNLYQEPDFWIWLYLTLVISSTMLPSASDRRAWLPLALLGFGLFGISLAAGAGPWLFAHFSIPLNRVYRAVAIVFGISTIAHLVFFLPFFALRKILARVMGVRVVEA